LLAAGSDILSSGSGIHITARDIELRAGGIDPAGGHIGDGNNLSLDAPLSAPGGGGTSVPSVLLLQNESPADPNVAAHTNEIDTVTGSVPITLGTFAPGDETTPETFLTTTFSTRTAAGTVVTVRNPDFFTGATAGSGIAGLIALAAQNASNALAANTASNAQGEGTLYIDWASFDPNVSLFGTVNPPICLPSDQSEEAEPADAAPTAAASSGCASSTARYDGPFRLPDVKLVITSRGVEWVTVPSGPVTVFPLIGRLR
jgi:hypothetical protein